MSDAIIPPEELDRIEKLANAAAEAPWFPRDYISAKFIADARTSVPRLLAHCRARDAEVSTLEAKVEYLRDLFLGWTSKEHPDPEASTSEQEAYFRIRKAVGDILTTSLGGRNDP